MSPARLRSARPDDADAIAALHAAVWHATYRDLAPPEAIAALDEARRRATWTAILAAPKPHQRAVVAECGGMLAGFGLAGPTDDPAFGGRGEVKYLYVDQARARQGIGRRMLSDLARFLRAEGFAGMALAVVEGNDRAFSFYAALGGVPAGRSIDPGPLWRSSNIIIAWDDLSGFGG